jgi:hypothetical protein
MCLALRGREARVGVQNPCRLSRTLSLTHATFSKPFACDRHGIVLFFLIAMVLIESHQEGLGLGASGLSIT